MADCGSNLGSHVSRIPGVRLDDAGFIHTPYGSYHPVTGEGLPIDAPKELTRQIQIALIDDGLDRGWQRISTSTSLGKR
jgi:hypothetical protein